MKRLTWLTITAVSMALTLAWFAPGVLACGYVFTLATNPQGACVNGGTANVDASVFSNGVGLPGHTITFTVSGQTSPGSIPSNLTYTTDNDGFARSGPSGSRVMPVYTSGSSTGTVTITATDTTVTPNQVRTWYATVSTPPSAPTITDDGQYTPSTSSLHASWTPTGCTEYQYAIGTSSSGYPSAGWDSVCGWPTSYYWAYVTKTGLNLTNGQTYYFSVRARNESCWGDTSVSDGITVDTSFPYFTHILADPFAAKYGDSVTITFTASEAQSANPTVTVNGHSASHVSHTGNNYTYSYTVQSSTNDPLGAATIVVTEASTANSTTDKSALWIYDSGTCAANSFTYDKSGNRKTACDSRGITLYAYDALNRLIKVIEPDGKWIAYEYDGTNNRTKMTIHLDSSTEHVTQYSYYDNGLLHEVTDQLSGITHYTYKDNGLVDTITYPNTTKAVHSYNSRNWLITISNQKSDNTIIAEFTYSYDTTYWGKNGTRTSVVENILKPDGNRISAQVDYEYDDLYRLTHEHRIAYGGGDAGVAYEYNFAYDAAGNRKSWQVVGGSTTNYTYDAANKMTSPGTFTYDDKGNISTIASGGVTTTYTWDLLNGMTQWSKTGQTTIDFLYNADGMRVRKTPSGGTATNFLLDGAEIVEEITGASVVAYVGLELVSQISGATRTIYHADGIGSTRAMSDGSQVVAEAGIYDAYGNLKAEYPASSAPSFGYAGLYRYYADSTGLDYLKARFYDPAVGQFLSRDPVAGSTEQYVYATGDPVNRIDPSGEKCTLVSRRRIPSMSAPTVVRTEYGKRKMQTGSEKGAFSSCYCLYKMIGTVRDHIRTYSVFDLTYSCMAKDKCGNWNRWTYHDTEKVPDYYWTPWRDLPGIGGGTTFSDPGTWNNATGKCMCPGVQ